MFNFSRIGEELSSWIAGATGPESLPGSDLLASAGIDLETLQGLPLGEVMPALTDTGINLLSEQPVTEVLHSLDADVFNR